MKEYFIKLLPVEDGFKRVVKSAGIPVDYEQEIALMVCKHTEGGYEVIGPVSNDACWVKEGHEFDNVDLRIIRQCSTHSSKVIAEALGKSWPHEAKSITTKGKVVRVEIRCKDCNKFHFIQGPDIEPTVFFLEA